MSGDKETLLRALLPPLANLNQQEEHADNRLGALRATKRSGLQPAMDFLLEHAEETIPDPAEEAEDDKAAEGGGLEAKSIKCTICGKIFRSSATAGLHAEKSGHEDFEESTEEIKPLTEEEKKAKLAELRERLALKRAAQSKEDEKEQRANEAIRRKAGQDTARIREELKIKEAQKDVERKKREKAEDLKARAAIKAQIEADKRERAEKAAREKALRSGQTPPPAATTAPVAAAAPKPATKSADNPETRLQIRLSAGGPPLTKTFPSDNTLIDVAEFVASQNLAYDVSTVKFACTFPRKNFSPEDMRKTLKENGLTPSAVLLAS